MQWVLAIVIFGYAASVCLRFYRRAPQRKAVPMLAALLLFSVGVFNDLLVAVGGRPRVLQKPFSVKSLSESVRAVLDG